MGKKWILYFTKRSEGLQVNLWHNKPRHPCAGMADSSQCVYIPSLHTTWWHSPPFTCHKHRPLISVLTSEIFKFMHHECRKVMTAEGRLHPHTLYLHIAVAMFLQTGACHRDIILGIDYHRIFYVLRLIARNKRLPVLRATDKLVVEVLCDSVELLKLPVVAVSPSYSIIFHLSLLIYCIISILPGHPAPPWSKPLSSWIGISSLPIPSSTDFK